MPSTDSILFQNPSPPSPAGPGLGIPPELLQQIQGPNFLQTLGAALQARGRERRGLDAGDSLTRIQDLQAKAKAGNLQRAIQLRRMQSDDRKTKFSQEESLFQRGLSKKKGEREERTIKLAESSARVAAVEKAFKSGMPLKGLMAVTGLFSQEETPGILQAFKDSGLTDEDIKTVMINYGLANPSPAQLKAFKAGIRTPEGIRAMVGGSFKSLSKFNRAKEMGTLQTDELLRLERGKAGIISSDEIFNKKLARTIAEFEGKAGIQDRYKRLQTMEELQQRHEQALEENDHKTANRTGAELKIMKEKMHLQGTLEKELISLRGDINARNKRNITNMMHFLDLDKIEIKGDTDIRVMRAREKALKERDPKNLEEMASQIMFKAATGKQLTKHDLLFFQAIQEARGITGGVFNKDNESKFETFFNASIMKNPKVNGARVRADLTALFAMTDKDKRDSNIQKILDADPETVPVIGRNKVPYGAKDVEAMKVILSNYVRSEIVAQGLEEAKDFDKTSKQSNVADALHSHYQKNARRWMKARSRETARKIRESAKNIESRR